MRTTSVLSIAVASLVARATAITPIDVKGAKLYTGDNQFFIKGIAYQLTGDDPLINSDQCSRDAALMKTIGTNSIRVYHVDASANHDSCMSAFAAAGIYIWLDLDTFDSYLNVAHQPSWTETQYSKYKAVMDTFQKYDNLAGFFVGNEVINEGAETIIAPYIKAAARDMKAYRDSKGYRQIPVGYSAADISELRPNLQNYLACGSNFAESVDFFSLNAYEWCGTNTYDGSGYSNLQAMAKDYPIPIYFSETGCNQPPEVPRNFGDQAAILGPDMDGTWSGAIIYEWIQEANDYGLINYAATSGAVSGTPTPIQPEWDNLSSQWATLNPTGTAKGSYSPSLSAPACPAFTDGHWLVNGDVPLPTLGQAFVSTVPYTPSSTPTLSTSSSSAASSSAASSTSSTSSANSSSSSPDANEVSSPATVSAGSSGSAASSHGSSSHATTTGPITTGPSSISATVSASPKPTSGAQRSTGVWLSGLIGSVFAIGVFFL